MHLCYSFGYECYSRGLPADPIGFKRRDDADDAGEFDEAPSVASSEYLPILEMGDASLNGGSQRGDKLVVCLVAD